MIKAHFKMDPKTDEISAVKIIGHAGAAEQGKDVVCAGVSALFLSTVNALEAYVGIEPNVHITPDVSELSIHTDTERQTIQAQTLMHALMLALRGMESELGQYVEVITEVKK